MMEVKKMTEYRKVTPSSKWTGGKFDTGGDSDVSYVGGKRQTVKSSSHKLGKIPRGKGTIGSGGKQTKGRGKA